MIDLRGMVSNRFGVGVLVRIESALGIQVRQLSLARGYPDSNPPKHVRVRWPSARPRNTRFRPALPLSHCDPNRSSRRV